MQIVLLAVAAATLVIPDAPAQAEVTAFTAGPAASNHGVSIHRGGGHRDGDRQNRRRHRNSQGGPVFGAWYDPDLNRSWEPDSYNDWWHDRPDRAYPRWMANNQNCERMWWSGGGWRC